MFVRALMTSAALAVMVFATVPAPSAAQSGGPWSLDDDGEDQAYQMDWPTSSPPVAKGVVASHIDLRKVEIGGEDAAGFYINYTVADLETGASVGQAYCYGSERIDIRFRIGDVELVIYTGLSGEWRSDRSAFIVRGAGACLNCQDFYRGCSSYRVDARVDAEREMVQVWVRKEYLIGRDPDSGLPGRGYPEELKVGDKIEDIHVTSSSQPADTYYLPNVHDYVPNTGSGPVYTIQRRMANDVLAARLEGTSLLPVMVNLNQSLSFILQNMGTAKRLITFDYEVLGDAAVLGEYRVHGPATASVPAGERRTFQMALTVGANAKATDNATLRIRGRSAGFPDELAFDQALLLPSPPIGVEANTIHLHVTPPSDGNQFCELPTYYNFLASDACSQRLFLSALKTDPGAPAEGKFADLLSVDTDEVDDGSYPLWVQMRGGAPAPLLFDLTKPVEIDIATNSQQELEDVTFSVEIKYYNASTGSYYANTLVAKSATETISQGDDVVTIKAPLKIKQKFLPRGTKFDMYISVTMPTNPDSAQAGLTRSLYYRAPQTQFRLPLLELPEELRVRLVESPFQLNVLGDREDFVNPGKAHAFNLTVFNQGRESHTARLGGQVGRDGWSIEFRPANEYKLLPGDTIRVAALVRVPSDAAEGLRVPFNVTLTDPQQHEIHLPLALIVTGGIELADDADLIETDEDAEKAAVRPPAQKAPGAGLGALLALVAVALLLGPRRRR